MVHPQDTPDSSDVPKRSSHFFRDIGKKQIIYIVLPLVLINAGIIHVVLNQVAIKAHADVANQVKDDTATVDAVNTVNNETIPEDAIVEDQPIITTYVVKSGDTLSGIAAKFNISTNTLRWANDLTEKTSKIAIGDELVILPVSGLEYTVKKGDTLSGIAAKYDVSQDDILKYNDIEAGAIKVGTDLILPGAEPLKAPVKAPAKKAGIKTTPKSTRTVSTAPTTSVSTTDQKAEEPTPSTTFAVPIPHSQLTQGRHADNGVDFGAPIGTAVYAGANGTVLIAKEGGYNGGFGSYVVINHPNGTQTLYAHLSKVSVSAGDTVSQGVQIAKSGNTGKSTGPHLHFEVHGAKNPFTAFKKGTQF